MKVLRIGDPHVTVSNLEESGKLMQFALELAQQEKVDRIELLGDQTHTHAVVRVEVLEFWNHWLDVFSDHFLTIVLVGNHDQVGDYASKAHALSVFHRLNKKNLRIIDTPTVVLPLAYMPYVHHEDKFLAQANELAKEGVVALVCHQTFNGAKYDNGMFAPDGFDPDKLNFANIISGHIHAKQKFGKVTYPGTARWASFSDANEEKGLWIAEHDDFNGSMVSERMIPTNHVCVPIVSVEWKEGAECPAIPDGSKVTVELIGSSDWISKQKIGLKGKVSIKTKITDSKKSVSRNAGKSLQDFIANTFVSTMDKQALMNFMKEIGLV